MKLSFLAISILLFGCANQVEIDSSAKIAISNAKAKSVRNSILSSKEFTNIFHLEERTFYFYLCEDHESEESGAISNCDFKVWLGDSKKYGCSTQVLVKEVENSYALSTGITLCH